MAKMTKTQMKNALKFMKNKAFRLHLKEILSIADYTAISKICNKGLNKLK